MTETIFASEEPRNEDSARSPRRTVTRVNIFVVRRATTSTLHTLINRAQLSPDIRVLSRLTDSRRQRSRPRFHHPSRESLGQPVSSTIVTQIGTSHNSFCFSPIQTHDEKKTKHNNVIITSRADCVWRVRFPHHRGSRNRATAHARRHRAAPRRSARYWAKSKAPTRRACRRSRRLMYRL